MPPFDVAGSREVHGHTRVVELSVVVHHRLSPSRPEVGLFHYLFAEVAERHVKPNEAYRRN